MEKFVYAVSTLDADSMNSVEHIKAIYSTREKADEAVPEWAKKMERSVDHRLDKALVSDYLYYQIKKMPLDPEKEVK